MLLLNLRLSAGIGARRAVAHATHQALKSSGQTTTMTAGDKPNCETVNLPAP
jgi:hypothetical protein